MSTYAGQTIILTPWAAQALSSDEIHAIAVRLVGAKARLNASKEIRDRSWVIRVMSWALDPDTRQPKVYIERRPYMGIHLADCIASILTEFEAEAGRYSPDELLTIANQSGLAVTRA